MNVKGASDLDCSEVAATPCFDSAWRLSFICCAAAAAGLSTYAVVLLVFRRKIQDAPELEEDIEPASLLRDK